MINLREVTIKLERFVLASQNLSQVKSGSSFSDHLHDSDLPQSQPPGSGMRKKFLVEFYLPIISGRGVRSHYFSIRRIFRFT